MSRDSRRRWPWESRAWLAGRAAPEGDARERWAAAVGAALAAGPTHAAAALALGVSSRTLSAWIAAHGAELPPRRRPGPRADLGVDAAVACDRADVLARTCDAARRVAHAAQVACDALCADAERVYLLGAALAARDGGRLPGQVKITKRYPASVSSQSHTKPLLMLSHGSIIPESAGHDDGPTGARRP